MSEAQEIEYMGTLHYFLAAMNAMTMQKNIKFIITTRNSAENVKWMLQNVVNMDASRFIIISDCDKVYDNKIQLVKNHFALNAWSGVCILVDDSATEHDAASEYAKKYCKNLTLRHVRVERPKRGALYKRQYGMMNQSETMKKFLQAISAWNLF